MRDGELVLQALLLLLGLQQPLQRAGHAVEGTGELGELVGATDANAVAEITAVDALRGHVEIGDRGGDRVADAQGEVEREDLDVGEEKDERGEQDQVDVGVDSADGAAEELVGEQRGPGEDLDGGVDGLLGSPIEDAECGGEADLDVDQVGGGWDAAADNGTRNDRAGVCAGRHGGEAGSTEAVGDDGH